MSGAIRSAKRCREQSGKKRAAEERQKVARLPALRGVTVASPTSRCIALAIKRLKLTRASAERQVLRDPRWFDASWLIDSAIDGGAGFIGSSRPEKRVFSLRSLTPLVRLAFFASR
jgi:hypothetical protein